MLTGILDRFGAGELKLGDSPQAFLHGLRGPTLIDVKGRDQSRCRMISTLVHGNEPSGFIALHRWLSEGHQPATNLCFILASVQAARKTPLFTTRYLAEEEDLNRCFGQPGHGPVYQRGRAIMQAIRELRPEVLLDLHNTSGEGPAFAVSVRDGDSERALAGYFTDTMILTGLRIGALMEQDFGCPNVTIECGGAGQRHSHQTAYLGIKSLCDAQDWRRPAGLSPVQVLRAPLRVELRRGFRLEYADTASGAADLCLRPDIESLNSGTAAAGTLLGRLGEAGLEMLAVRNERGEEVSRNLFSVKGDCLVSRVPLRIFMATPRVDIATTDCLFYVVAV
ncbi:M14 family metallopeptidase [Bowmanella dokdonensis]|uniref:Succinylglutamate desuccinylase/aspartoacylase family protein n=1 Tax=Bowmanella dokdonensis TaxID=751969 RepID=A0A939DSK8_9ALTE|nr:succinylglutamate desuccinylase/aspartoacylase family protein [Bowmanella dokdonensis]MBN7827592.1 succinylglutamate desuccinylase/aspartoacylase family protein [Bowmanella dokdonensis]